MYGDNIETSLSPTVSNMLQFYRSRWVRIHESPWRNWSTADHTFLADLFQTYTLWHTYPDSKVHGANMGLIRGQQDPDGAHVGPMDFAIWVVQYKRNSAWFMYFCTPTHDKDHVNQYLSISISHIWPKANMNCMRISVHICSLTGKCITLPKTTCSIW